jgi:hypothetical protein
MLYWHREPVLWAYILHSGYHINSMSYMPSTEVCQILLHIMKVWLLAEENNKVPQYVSGVRDGYAVLFVYVSDSS